MSISSRLFQAFLKQGLELQEISQNPRILEVSQHHISAQILLPEDFPLEIKAFLQLMSLASVKHPHGGYVMKACATPDFHPGDGGVAIGSVVQMHDMVLPAAVGEDINCGMRMHHLGLSLDTFMTRKKEFIDLLKQSYLLGQRDFPMSSLCFQALFKEGILGWLSQIEGSQKGMFATMDFKQLWKDAERIFENGSLRGSLQWIPDSFFQKEGLIRDDGLATIGSGNHFVEIQVVEEIYDRQAAWELGLKLQDVTLLIHSGSRYLGGYMGRHWHEVAQSLWPPHVPFPSSSLFPISRVSHPQMVEDYLLAEAAASHYGFLNRLLLAEMAKYHLRYLFGDQEAPLVVDIPHNITLAKGDSFVARKGACPALEGQAVLIPGSMGSSSYLLKGCGSERFLESASHGAGRAVSRFSMEKKDEGDLGLEGVECYTLREERRFQEAPAAYKPVQPVIEAQIQAGLVSPVVRLKPLVTFKQ